MKKRLILTAVLTILSLGVLPMESKAASWLKTSSGWRYQTGNNEYVTDTWRNIDNKWYSFSSSGIMRTGWFKDRDSNWYYLDATNGYMRTGWVYVDSNWYYLDTASGYMRTGWVLVDGSWYYLDAARGGAMASNTTVEGKYTVDTSGRWVSNSSSEANNDFISDYEREVVRLVNIERNNRGLSSLTISDKLSKAADVRAVELVDKFSHERPNGTKPWTAADEAGYKYSTIAENIAAGYSSPQEVVDGWMNSDGHRKNILNSRFTQIGVGCFEKADSEYRTHWVQLFGTPN